jgi:probable F420-dependent oxidoreductase
MTAHTARPIRFGIGVAGREPKAAVEAARQAERRGFSTVALSDHFMSRMSPVIGLQAIADATESIRLTNTVLDQDFRHPAVLAKDLATIDVLSGGRLEVGIGAGWMRSEYDQTGLRYDSAGVRIERLEEYVTVLYGLFGEDPFTFEGKHFTIKELQGTPTPTQRPGPPLLIGGGGRKLLGVAARRADIIQVTVSSSAGGMSPGPSDYTPQAFSDKVAIVRDEAGGRFDEIELGIMMEAFVIADDQDRTITDYLAQRSANSPGFSEFSAKDVIESPAFAIGTVEQVSEKLLEVRERFGFSNFALNYRVEIEAAAPVIEQLVGK